MIKEVSKKNSFQVNKETYKSLFDVLEADKHYQSAFKNDKTTSLLNINNYQNLNNFKNYDFIDDFDLTLTNNVLAILYDLSIQYNIRDEKSQPPILTSEFLRPQNIKSSNDFRIPILFNQKFNTMQDSNSKKSYIDTGFLFCQYNNEFVPCLAIKWPFSSAKKYCFLISLNKNIPLMLKIDRNYYDKIMFFKTINELSSYTKKTIINIYYNYIKHKLQKEFTLTKASFKKLTPEEILIYVNLANMYNV